MTSSSFGTRPRNLIPISKSQSQPPLLTTVTNSNTSRNTFEGRGQDRSATVTKLQREIKCLNEENINLKEQLSELRESVKQVVTESRHEKYDERRINLIKFQVIQLERQISILTEALGNRSEVLLEVENNMAAVANKLRSYIASEVKGKMVPVARSDFMSLVEYLESSRIKLFRSIEKNTQDELGKDLLFLNPCLNQGKKQEQPITVLDVNLNRLDYINLRHVSQMESKLSLLYKELVRVHNQVETLQGNGYKSRLSFGHISEGENDRVKTSLLKAATMIKDCTDDLLALSLLCPSAPWPALKRPVMKDIPLERIMATLPPLPGHKQEEVKHVLKSCVNTLNYRIHMLHKEKAVLEEELAFHRSVYDTELKYTNVAFDAIKEGCKEFEESARNLLCDPLKSIMESYKLLQTCRSKDALREILLVLKANETQMSSIIEMFDASTVGNALNRKEALSEFSTEFLRHVDNLILLHKKKRDEEIQKKKEVRESLNKSSSELQKYIEELEAKYDKEWTVISRHDGANVFSHYKTPDLDSKNSLPEHCFEASVNVNDSDRSRNYVDCISTCEPHREFIHNQLVDDLHDKDNRKSRRSESRRQHTNKSSGRESNMSSKSNLNSIFDSCDMSAFKLRSFLDSDEDDTEYASPNDDDSRTFLIHDKKWVSDFSSPKHKDIEECILKNNTDSITIPNSRNKSRRRQMTEKKERVAVKDFSFGLDFSNNQKDCSSFDDLNHYQQDEPMDFNHKSNSDMQQSNMMTSSSKPQRHRKSGLKVAMNKLTLKRSQSITTDVSNL